MIEFDKCCFCIPLRTGCLILGYLHMIASISLTVVTILVLVAASSMVTISNKIGTRSALDLVIAISSITLILVLILLFFSIVLVIGLHKEYRGHVKAYLIYYLVFLILYSVMFIVNLSTQPFVVAYTVITLFEILLGVYFFLVIRSHWVVMRDDDTRGA